MSGVFFYTFRTNKYVAELEEALGQRIYVVDKPAQDFRGLLSAIEQSRADKICGIGMSKRYTRFEKKTFNRVGKNKIDSDGPDDLELDIPSGSAIKADTRMTFGPCNQVAFKLKSGLPGNKYYFLHLRPKDIVELKSLANQL